MVLIQLDSKRVSTLTCYLGIVISNETSSKLDLEKKLNIFECPPPNDRCMLVMLNNFYNYK